jgi:hypothetical protein
MIRMVLRDIARAALLASLVATTGACSSSIDRDGFDGSSFCASFESRLEALRVNLGADYVALVRGEEVSESPRCGEGGGACVVEREAAKTMDPPPELGGGQAGGFVLLVVKGGEAKTARRVSDLSAVLGAIDSPEKVHLVMWSNGYEIECDRWVKRTGDGFEAIGKKTVADCTPIITEEHRVSVRRDATIAVVERVEVERNENACIGRRPAGLVSHAKGGRFAHAAHLEAASVHAFRVLASELALHDAPHELIAEAKRSARDEIRHAAMMARFAKRFGATFEPPVVEPREPRSLFDLALDNATEGCVRETYGAVEAMILAETERDPEIARAMHAIANDETRHAELAWSIAAWANERLHEADRGAIATAMTEAIAELPDVPAVALMKERVWSLSNASRRS